MNYLMPQTANVAEQVKVLAITQHVQLKVARAFKETNLQPFVPNEKGLGGLDFFKQSQKLQDFSMQCSCLMQVKCRDC